MGACRRLGSAGPRANWSVAHIHTRERADADRLIGCARSPTADRSNWSSEGVGNQRAHDGTTNSSLTRPHAAARKSLDLVRTDSAEPNRLTDFAGGNFLAAADNGFVSGRDQNRAARPVKAIQERPRYLLALERGADWPRAAVALRLVDMSEQHRGIERCKLSRQARRFRTADPACIPGDRNRRQAALTPRIENGLPAELIVVPFVLQLQREADLDIRDDAFMDQKMIGAKFAAAPRIPAPRYCARSPADRARRAEWGCRHAASRG